MYSMYVGTQNAPWIFPFVGNSSSNLLRRLENQLADLGQSKAAPHHPLRVVRSVDAACQIRLVTFLRHAQE
jgi:hypothetical protein